ncbi:MAG: RNA methyltransferase [Opitutaceae bacterium]|nr:RNA methyltransferase [Opitutaceae bacterium]
MPAPYPPAALWKARKHAATPQSFANRGPACSCRPVPLTKAELTRLRDLREKKHREAAGLFVIEGEKVIGELLAAKYPLLELYATTAWPDLAAVGGVPSPRETSAPPAATSGMMAPRPQVFELTPEEMARASHFPTPSTVLAVGKINRVPLAPGALDRGLTLVLDGIQDPGNVGTLLRLADWFGLDRVLLSPDCADLFSQKVINASMGSFARVTVHTAPLEEALADAKVPVLGCDLAGYDVHTLKPAKDAVIVVGSEGRGISPAVMALVTKTVTIPRYGPGAESLNAAVAAAIVCDNLRRLSS